jgi:hypothetical protein
MNPSLKTKFTSLWEKYFPGAEFPIVLYYTDDESGIELVQPATSHRCLLASLVRVRKGTPLRFDRDSIECTGGKRYTGFHSELRQNFKYFLSCGIPGQMEGERYKKTPEIVEEYMRQVPNVEAPGKYIIFKRWDQLNETDKPDVVIFFAKPDVLAGLFTLASFDEVDNIGVITPFGAGCGTIVQYPFIENRKANPRCVIGMFDPSARPFIPADTISFSAPMTKFVRMVDNMDESFLITPTWDKIRKRIDKAT